MRVFIVGGGRPVYFLTKAFFSKGHSVTIVNRSHSECVDLARRLKATVVHGDGADPAVLQEAKVHGADAFIAITPFDHDNLVACQLAQLEFRVPRVLALVDDPQNRELFESLGIKVFSATTNVVSLIEQQTILDAVTNSMQIGGGSVNVTEVEIAEDSPVVATAIRDVGLPRDSLIAVIMRDDSPHVPHGDTVIHARDRVVVITVPDNHGPVLRMLTGEAE